MLDEKSQIKKTKKSFSLKRLSFIVVIIFITTAAIGFPIWWRLTKVVEVQREQIDFLETQVETLSEKLKDFSD